METWNLVLPTWIMFLWICGIRVNNNQPLLSFKHLKTKLLPLSPPDHNTNSQACLAATQTPSGKKSEEIKEIARASMAPVEVKSIRATDPMVVFRAKWVSSRNLPILVEYYDTV